MPELFAALTDGKNHPNGWPAAVRICSQTEARRMGAEWDPTHIISIYGPQNRYLGLPDFDQTRQLHSRFDDVTGPAEDGAPTPAHIDEITAFVDALPADARVLIHCLQGTSRSAAVVLGILARMLPADKAGQTLFKACPDAAPNQTLVALWDKKLGLDGKLIKAGRKFPTKVLREQVA